MIQLKEIDGVELWHLTDKEDLVIVDVRSAAEYQRQTIAKSINLPLDELDVSRWRKLVTEDNKSICLVCQTGVRSKKAFDVVKGWASGDIYSLLGGINNISKELLGSKQSSVLPLTQQVFIAVGILVLTGVVLGFSVNPDFYLINGLVGAGLVLTGITGFCGIAKVLLWMPWNKVKV